MDPTLPPVLIGSHLDTQQPGGKFDGPLGVLGGDGGGGGADAAAEAIGVAAYTPYVARMGRGEENGFRRVYFVKRVAND